MAAIGGSIGAWLGMKVWHHKTLHKKFRYGIPLILITQLALLFLCSCNTNHRFFKPKEQSDACIGYASAGKRAC
jgi:hypothetical protein